MTEQKDIWHEKPKPVKVEEEYADDYYHAAEMDAFHEDVRAHQKDLEQIIKNQEAIIEALKEKLDASKKEGLEHHAIAVEYYEKLEAVKEWCEAYKPPKRSFNKLNQEPFIQLEKILEGGI